MLYKTIVLELLEQSPQYENLRQNRTLLATTEAYAAELKVSHEQLLMTHSPEAASELAIKEMEERLLGTSQPA